jgi:ABC-type glycerol-3-phosphate transport system substrate-binding protein
MCHSVDVISVRLIDWKLFKKKGARVEHKFFGNMSKFSRQIVVLISMFGLIFGSFSISAHAAQVTGTVEIWTWNNEGDYVKVDNDAIARFKVANPEANVKISYIPYADYVTKLKAALTAGNPPDIAQIPWTSLTVESYRRWILI